MTIAQADNYILAAEDQTFLAMGQTVNHGQADSYILAPMEPKFSSHCTHG
jgi:hypothetical protein